MKVIGIAGSLRAKSNTLHYIKNTLAVFDSQGFDTELISLRGKEIKPCNGCYDCVKKGYCTIKGDDFNEILEKMRTAGGIILGSPVYLSSVVPQMMALLPGEPGMLKKMKKAWQRRSILLATWQM